MFLIDYTEKAAREVCYFTLFHPAVKSVLLMLLTIPSGLLGDPQPLFASTGSLSSMFFVPESAEADLDALQSNA